MPDLAHIFGNDLAISPTGDLATVDGPAWTQQRVLHRLLTPVQGYIWQLAYGSGLPQMVGDPVALQAIQGIVVEQMRMEVGVDQTQPIGVDVVTDNLGTVTLSISYTDAATGQATELTLPLF